jgi:hypothetical protein
MRAQVNGRAASVLDVALALIAMALAWLGLRLVNVSSALVSRLDRRLATTRPPPVQEEPVCVIVALPPAQHDAAVLGARWHDIFSKREGRA